MRPEITVGIVQLEEDISLGNRSFADILRMRQASCSKGAAFDCDDAAYGLAICRRGNDPIRMLLAQASMPRRYQIIMGIHSWFLAVWFGPASSAFLSPKCSFLSAEALTPWFDKSYGRRINIALHGYQTDARHLIP